MMVNLELEKKERLDYVTTCPMCGEKDSMNITFQDAFGYVVREVHICQPCPCIWFDYYSQEDVDRLVETLLTR